MTGSRTFSCVIGIAVTAMVLLLVSPWRVATADPVGVTACSVPTAKSGLKSFFRAFNQGDTEALDVVFDDEPGFQWFSSGPPGDRGGPAAFRRSTLLGYFRSRHRLRDRLSLRRFGRVMKGHGGPEYKRATHFSFVVSRRSKGFRGNRWFRTVGKGALVCAGDQPRIIVISIGGPEPIQK